MTLKQREEDIDIASNQMMDEFRQRLIRWMDEEEVTKYAFCNDCNIDRNGLQRFLKGSGGISASTMFKFAMVSGISIDGSHEQSLRLMERIAELEKQIRG